MITLSMIANIFILAHETSFYIDLNARETLDSLAYLHQWMDA